VYTRISEFVNKITTPTVLIGGGPFCRRPMDLVAAGPVKTSLGKAVARPTETGKPVAAALGSSALDSQSGAHSGV
jgi:hypothetical protein